jgi:hypothetical protein
VQPLHPNSVCCCPTARDNILILDLTLPHDRLAIRGSLESGDQHLAWQWRFLVFVALLAVRLTARRRILLRNAVVVIEPIHSTSTVIVVVFKPLLLPHVVVASQPVDRNSIVKQRVPARKPVKTPSTTPLTDPDLVATSVCRGRPPLLHCKLRHTPRSSAHRSLTDLEGVICWHVPLTLAFNTCQGSDWDSPGGH